MGKIKSVLFVCTGNSCRSVMAEGLLKKYLKELGKDDIEVHSAGIMPLGGLPPTEETIQTMKEEGVDVSGVRSHSLTDEMIRKADLILVMERLHKEEIIRRIMQAVSKTYLLKEFDNPEKTGRRENSDIPDPIGRPMKYYRYCISMIKKEIERIAKSL